MLGEDCEPGVLVDSGVNGDSTEAAICAGARGGPKIKSYLVSIFVI